MQVCLSGSIRKDDNSISVQVKDTYRPTIPINLIANMPQTLTGTQLRNIFGNGSGNDLSLTGITSKDIVMNQALPEGNYTICIQVKNYSTGQVIAEDCRNIYVAYYEPPQIISPYNSSAVTATDPQYVLTSWTPVTPFIQGLSYRLRIVKLLSGVSPLDALNNSTQVIMERTNIPTPNYPLDLASGIKLDTGSVYVMQITASSPSAFFKNNGRSEPVVFSYKQGINIPHPNTLKASSLSFLNPYNKNDTLKTNNEANLLINWSWLKKPVNISKSKQLESGMLIDDSATVKLGITKYVLTIVPANADASTKNTLHPFSFTKEIEKKHDTLNNFISMNAASADSAGFINNGYYIATVKAYDVNAQLISSTSSQNFIYRRIKDEEPVYQVPVQAIVKYAFKGFPEVYAANNTDATVEVFKKKINRHTGISNNSLSDSQMSDDMIKKNTNIQTNKSVNEALQKGKLSDNNLLPEVDINLEKYISIAKATGVTDKDGVFRVVVSIPQKYFTDDSIYYRLKLNNQYYVDKKFKLLSVPVSVKDSNSINFGQMVAQTYAYSLKLNVTKAYTSYKLNTDKNNLNVSLGDKQLSNNQSGFQYQNKTDGKTYMEYYVEKKTLAAGIPVVLYRRYKKTYIPPVEGDIRPDSISSKKSITVIAYGVTQVEKDSTYVKFDRLLSSVFNDDQYYIMAMSGSPQTNEKDDKDLPKKSESINGKPVQQSEYQKTDYDKINHTELTIPIISSFGDLQKAVSDFKMGDIGNNITQTAAGQAASMSFRSKSSGETIYADTGYIAQEQPFKLSLPENMNTEDALYRNVKANYEIVSSKPPTSLVKGKLYYTWKSDKQSQKRPLANASFKIVVDYLADGKPIGSTTKVSSQGGGSFSMSQQFFVPDGKDDYSAGLQLLDQNATMAVGHTDDQGNFQVEVVNINKKGDLGPGNMVSKDWHINTNEETTAAPGGNNPAAIAQNAKNKVINPENQGAYAGAMGVQMGASQTKGAQSTINASSITAGSVGSFEIGASTNKTKAVGAVGSQMQMAPIDVVSGPNHEEVLDDDPQDATHVKSFSRVFRIVPTEDVYYYPGKETLTIQSFEASSTPFISTSYVKEFTLKVHTQELSGNNKVSLPGMRVTVFRDIKDKPERLPLGEGDGKYTFAKLLNPQYNTTGEKLNTDLANKLKNNDILNTKYEQVCTDLPVADDGSVVFPSLLQAEADNHYYIEACSQVNDGDKTYQATFAAVPSGNSDNNEPGYWTGDSIPPIVPLDIILSPLPSRVLLSVHNKSDIPISGITGGAVVHVNQAGDNSLINFLLGLTDYPTDKYGHIEMLATAAPLIQYAGTGKTASFTAGAKGYKPSTNKVEKSFAKQGAQFTQTFNLEPSAIIKGRIVCPDEKIFGIVSGVKAYLQIDGGVVEETDDNGNFNFGIAGISNTKIKIIPKDVAYFDTTYLLTSSDANKQIIDLKNFNVYKRMHRISFDVTAKVNTNANNAHPRVQGATIQLGDRVITTNSLGKANFAFENVSVNNYTFVIKGPAGQNYIPQIINLPNEESKGFENKEIQLEKGSEVSGNVTLDGKPVKNAKVYIDVANTTSQLSPNVGALISQSTQINTSTSTNQLSLYTNTASSAPSGKITNDANLIIAFTDAKGNYKLQGVPVDNQTINIIATIDTSFTVSGDNQKAVIKNHLALTNLALTGFNKAQINSIYGFPLTVEKVTPVNDKQVKVSGLIHWTKAISNFNLEEVSQVLRIEDVLFDLVNINGSVIGIAKDSILKLNGISSLKLSYLNKYNVELFSSTASGSLLQPQSLTLCRENGYGKLKGKMHIVDNSFNYPSSYLSFDGSGPFYLASKERNDIITNNLSVVTSALAENELAAPENKNLSSSENRIQAKINNYRMQAQPAYNLSNAKGEALTFSLIGFKATANPTKSFIDLSGKIHLNTSLNCIIPNAQPDKLNVLIDDMILDDNKVYPATNTSPINLALEKWNLKVNNWSFSVKEGGIISHDALLQTTAVEIPMGEFVLRHDLFHMDHFKMKELSMAGGKIKLQDIDTTNAHLNYDYKTGKDMMPHWSFGLVGIGNKPVATLPALKDLGGSNDHLMLNYIQILSDNEVIFQLQQQDKPFSIRNNTLANFSPQSIFNGPDYISIAGAINVGAPRMGDIPLTMRYTAPQQTMTLETVCTEFEAPGFVHFIANKDNIAITKSLITIDGTVQEKPVATFNPIPSRFSATSDGLPAYRVDLQKDWITQLTSEEPAVTSGSTPKNISNNGYKLKIDQGDMYVKNGDWTTLKFGGLMSSNNASFGSQPTHTNFEILGDISANSESLTVSNFDSPFGTMTQTFDFANKRLIGSVKINTPITLGATILKNGTIETCFDNTGFYVAGSCSTFIPAGLLAGDYNLGFIAGNYALNDHLWSVANSAIDPAVVDFCYKNKVKNISGVYFAANRELLNVSAGFNFIIASGYVKAVALVGGDFYANFGSPFTIGGSGYAHFYGGAGLSSITGTSISGYLGGDAIFNYSLDNVGLTMDLSFGGSINQSLGFTSISKSFSVSCSATAKTSGFGFQLQSGDQKNTDCK
jgi:hypothetical protein